MVPQTGSQSRSKTCLCFTSLFEVPNFASLCRAQTKPKEMPKMLVLTLYFLAICSAAQAAYFVLLFFSLALLCLEAMWLAAWQHKTGCQLKKRRNVCLLLLSLGEKDTNTHHKRNYCTKKYRNSVKNKKKDIPRGKRNKSAFSWKADKLNIWTVGLVGLCGYVLAMDLLKEFNFSAWLQRFTFEVIWGNQISNREGRQRDREREREKMKKKEWFFLPWRVRRVLACCSETASERDKSTPAQFPCCPVPPVCILSEKKKRNTHKCDKSA